MNITLILSLWVVMAVSIVYCDTSRWKEQEPLSACHNAQIRVYHDRPMCTECKLYCEVIDEKRKSN